MRFSILLQIFSLYAVTFAAPIDQRQSGLATAISTFVSVFDAGLSVFDEISKINDKAHAMESSFVQGLLANLAPNYPDKNILIYHDQDSDISGLVNVQHEHQELDLPSPFGTMGYEILTFDYGTFVRAGDGGWINWGYNGNVEYRSDDGKTVKFDQKATDTAPPPSPPSSVPVPPPTPQRAVAGDVDGNYFVNCINNIDGLQSSGVAYYKNLNPGQNVGQKPDDYVDVTHGSQYTWEQAGQITFPSTGTTVRWNIFGSAGDSPANSAAGTADNGYENFWAYRDAGEYLYTIDTWDCSAIYWVF